MAQKQYANGELGAKAFMTAVIHKIEFKVLGKNKTRYLQIQLRWQNSYCFLQIFSPVEIQKAQKYKINDVIEIEAQLDNPYEAKGRKNIMLLQNPTMLRKVGRISKEYQKKV